MNKPIADLSGIEIQNLLRFWGKTGAPGEDATRFHPALYHMLDAGLVARELLAPAASPRWRNMLATAFGIPPEVVCIWTPYLVAMHDIGKISADFQSQVDAQRQRLERAGIAVGSLTGLHHPLIGQVFIREGDFIGLPMHVRKCWSEMIGGHHGWFSLSGEVSQARTLLARSERPLWAGLRRQAAEWLRLALLPEQPPRLDPPANASAAIMALTGFTILCDWIASDSAFFAVEPEILPANYLELSAARAKAAVENAGFHQTSRSTAPLTFNDLFGQFSPRPLQLAIDAIPTELLARSCLAVIEAPTGEGKTEAALALAHRLAQSAGSDELYYALPTTATSNQMHTRIEHYLDQQLDLEVRARLVHGQSFQVEFSRKVLQQGEPGEVLRQADWFTPKKRALLAAFGVGTVDQAELAALQVRHGALRLVGLAGKVLIIDEVHAYDAYMTTIIERLLEWLAALGTSVILLSATLPASRRERLFKAYGAARPPEDDPSAYPQIRIANRESSYTANPPAYQPDRRIALAAFDVPDDDADSRSRWLMDQIKDGGCVAYIANTVERAQQTYAACRAVAPAETDLLLIHARFPFQRRQDLEQALMARYGPTGSRPARGIVIATQVLEQSLDLDFDAMLTDLAPVDLLLQRAGRMHRHARPRPGAHATPRLTVALARSLDGELTIGVDKYIYDEYILRRSWHILSETVEIVLPRDYRPLIEAVYHPGGVQPGDPLFPFWQALKKREAIAVLDARQRLIPPPSPALDLPFTAAANALIFADDETNAGWLAAKTRLGEESLTVALLDQHDGGIRLAGFDHPVPLDQPVAGLAIENAILAQNLRISRSDVIEALKAQPLPALFAQSPHLKGIVPLLAHDGAARLVTSRGVLTLYNDPELGLMITKEGGK